MTPQLPSAGYVSRSQTSGISPGDCRNPWLYRGLALEPAPAKRSRLEATKGGGRYASEDP